MNAAHTLELTDFVASPSYATFVEAFVLANLAHRRARLDDGAVEYVKQIRIPLPLRPFIKGTSVPFRERVQVAPSTMTVSTVVAIAKVTARLTVTYTDAAGGVRVHAHIHFTAPSRVMIPLLKVAAKSEFKRRRASERAALARLSG